MAKMKRNHEWLTMMALVLALSFVMVAAKYWLWEVSRHANPATGIGIAMSPSSSAYVKTLDLMYFPGRSVIDLLIAPLAVGGVAIDALADFVAITLQNCLAAFAWLAYRHHGCEK